MALSAGAGAGVVQVFVVVSAPRSLLKLAGPCLRPGPPPQANKARHVQGRPVHAELYALHHNAEVVRYTLSAGKWPATTSYVSIFRSAVVARTCCNWPEMAASSVGGLCGLGLDYAPSMSGRICASLWFSHLDSGVCFCIAKKLVHIEVPTVDQAYPVNTTQTFCR